MHSSAEEILKTKVEVKKRVLVNNIKNLIKYKDNSL